jgi:anti-sigma regulatory factor (Ser/Thr protein kinase)
VGDSHPFRLSNDLGEVPALRELFERACLDAGLGEEEREGSKLVITELLNNAIEHGCSCDADHVEGWYRITAASIEIEVTDPSGCLTEDDFRNSDASGFAENGRGAGLFLVQALTDQVTVRRADGGGTTVHIVKYRGQGAVP